jgi:hypothetical protein
VSPRHLILAFATAALAGCDGPWTPEQFHDFTGLELCPRTEFRDLTTKAQLDGPLGYDCHLQLIMTPPCDADFQRQLRRAKAGACADDPATGRLTCLAKEASSAFPTRSRVSVTLSRLGPGLYDVWLWQ